MKKSSKKDSDNEKNDFSNQMEHERHKFTILNHITTKEMAKLQYIFENQEKKLMDKFTVNNLKQNSFSIVYCCDGRITGAISYPNFDDY